MSLTITVPGLGKKKSSVKDIVISTLAIEHPLTLTKLKNSIKKKFSSPVTFQGVRRAVIDLTEQNIIEKKEKEYSLSKQWIQRLRDFTEQTEQSYFSETNIRNFEALGDDFKIYTFNNLIDTDQFLNRLIGEWFKENPRGTYLQKAAHAYFMVGNLEEENKINEIMKKYKIKFYTLVGGNTFMDKWAGSYFKKLKFHYKSGEGNTTRYFAVYNDYLFQYETPKEFSQKLDNVYKKAKKLEDMDMVGIIKLLRQNIGIKVTVMRNPLLAEQLRNLILSHFFRL